MIGYRIIHFFPFSDQGIENFRVFDVVPAGYEFLKGRTNKGELVVLGNRGTLGT